jgi:hypothetical protein
MITLRGIAVTDHINRYNEKLAIEGIVRAYARAWNEEQPMSVNHDHTKCIGMTRLTGIYIEPGTLYQTNDARIPENKDEKENIQKRIGIWDKKKKYVEKKDLYLKLEEMLSDKITEKHVWLWDNAVTLIDIGIVGKVFPEILNESHDGLYPLKMLQPVLPGVYKKGDFLIFAHPYFRRNLSRINTLNAAFLSRLEGLKDTELDVKIAIDLDMIGLCGTQRESREYQYWWGPSFDNNLSNIQNGVARFENENYDELMSNIRQTEFSWYTQDERKTFECEEITDIPNIVSNGEEYYGCRFTHSMLDSETRLPYHLDGAIRAYTDEKMLTRLDVSLVQTERDTVYTKIWRIDNQIQIEIWKELITHYYRDNHLVGEYFGGIDKNVNQSTQIEQTKSTNKKPLPIKKYIPIDLRVDDGIRASVQFHPCFVESDKFDITIKSSEYLFWPDHREKCFENETITLIKMLKRKGVKIRVPFMQRLAFEDTILNFPIFRCNNIEIAENVQKCILEFCQVWNKNQYDRLISYSVQVNIDDKSVLYSFAGNMVDLEKFLCAMGTKFPKEENIPNWVKRVSEISNSLFTTKESFKITELMRPDGTLHFNRQWIEEKYISNTCIDKKGIYATVSIPIEDSDCFIENNIQAAGSYIIKESQCSCCGKDYTQCDCIKIIDDNVTEVIKKHESTGTVWTIHHA